MSILETSTAPETVPMGTGVEMPTTIPTMLQLVTPHPGSIAAEAGASMPLQDLGPKTFVDPFIGQRFSSKREMKDKGYFARINQGIDYRAGHPATSVCLAGNYEYDLDASQIIYTGHGGRTIRYGPLQRSFKIARRPHQDQLMWFGNKAMQMCVERKTSVRVFKKSGRAYIYIGRFAVTSMKEDLVEGFKVFRFQLDRLQ